MGYANLLGNAGMEDPAKHPQIFKRATDNPNKSINYI